ncbi:MULTISPECIES: GNAT family N-acetyltransferase [Paenibacillus]|uniref:GNAT family N-acetyltransferase n=1 Tax=Paenibacillus TaxID=44249 RepID=UPI0009564FF3|nr:MULTISPECIES: GNAT family N-acetyltransferase [Paenibacillus]ASS65602.1 GNAT family N-acetyltransferase [Paenibacillus sp. RUD330]SIQ30203.1 L-amino acid N-acyltransferase YncA [Paenibacillus sp. RU4X]SIQ52090.1 L-amino acid N-acyltransferase YncA [Paenibacillus sp. RU4T]
MESEALMGIRDAKPGDGAGIAAVQVGSWRTTYKDIVDPAYLQAMEAGPRQAMWERTLAVPDSGSCTLVLENGDGRIVGFLKAGKSRDLAEEGSAELYVLYLLEAYQGAGWGTELFRTMRGRLQDLGYLTLHAWVLEGNPAIFFYEKMGARDYGMQETVEIGARTHIERSMEWKTIF